MQYQKCNVKQTKNMEEYKMVTLDKIVKNVGKFSGDIKNHRAYERAKENVELITNDVGMLKLEETLKKETGYNEFNMPKEPQQHKITLGDISFSVKTVTTTKRPQYKTAVTQMETYLNGISLLVSQDRIIMGVAKEEGKWCISADKLLEQYELILAGVKSAGIKQTIKYEAPTDMIKEVKEIDLSTPQSGELTAENFSSYVKADTLRDISEKYTKAYEKELKSKDKIGDITPVNTRKGFKEESSTTEGVDWVYVVNKLVNTDELSDDDGELNVLADPNISLKQKKKELPFYDLYERTVYGEKKTYVGIESVYNRIHDLKDQKSITTNRTKYIAKELV